MRLTILGGAVLSLATLTLNAPAVDASASYLELIPNGNNYDPDTAMLIGHSASSANDKNANSFGKAFKSAGNKWTKALCQADTDGDGQTNGQELGDPCCVWTPGNDDKLAFTDGVSFPGDSKKKVDASILQEHTCSTTTTAPNTTQTTNTTTTSTPTQTPSKTTTTTTTSSQNSGASDVTWSVFIGIGVALATAFIFARD